MAYDVLTDVKDALRITGTYHDKTLNVHIRDIKDYLTRAGIPSTVVDSEACSGVITRGVNDLMTGNALSPYFYDKVTQLCLSTVSRNTDDEAHDCCLVCEDDNGNVTLTVGDGND